MSFRSRCVIRITRGCSSLESSQNSVPISKKRRSPWPENYRPTFLPSIVSKVFETNSSNHMSSFCERERPPRNRQCGYWRRRSAGPQLAQVRHSWSIAFDNNGESYLVSLNNLTALEEIIQLVSDSFSISNLWSPAHYQAAVSLPSFYLNYSGFLFFGACFVSQHTFGFHPSTRSQTFSNHTRNISMQKCHTCLAFRSSFIPELASRGTLFPLLVFLLIHNRSPFESKVWLPGLFPML